MTHKAIYMKRIILGSSLLFCALFTAPAMHAQESVEVLIRENGTERQESIELPKSMTYPLDSLLNDWKAKNYIDLGKDCSTSTVNPMFSDSVYIDRLSRMPTVMEMPYNEIVRKFIDMYAGRLRNQVAFMLSACNFYMPIFEEALDAYGLPLELKYLPIIESALNPSAVSRAGACGLWQFMLATGKIYGLESNSLVDERRDPIKATWAAARYLKDMYDIYKDWNLVIAAYNCGPGNVNKALARAGEKSRTFWDIYDYLPRETRGYVPAFIGASYAYAYHRQHGIELTEAPIPLATDTVRIDRIMHLQQIASTIDVPIETLRQLNPQYKLDIIPATTKPYTLVLPQRSLTQYVANEPAILAKDSLYLKEYINPANLDKKRQERSGTVYTVKKGDTLGAIARRYRVTTAQLMRWNNIKSAHKLRIGQRLRIEGR